MIKEEVARMSKALPKGKTEKEQREIIVKDMEWRLMLQMTKAK